MTEASQILALCGGVGGAKLATGLAELLGGRLSIIVNTGDDFDHLGLRICPDLDSVCYALADLNDTERGWGRREESWNFLSVLKELGGPGWFQLGDKDLATHVFRTELLRRGESLTAATKAIAEGFGILAQVLPMSDDPVATVVETDEGTMSFQTYFVARQCQPKVLGVRFDGAKTARSAEALLSGPYDGIVICPSNPLLSIDPLLALPGVREALASRRCPAVAVSPFIRRQAVKGPAAKMFDELGLVPDAGAIATHYSDLIDALVVEEDDVDHDCGPVQLVADRILMRTQRDRVRLARLCLDVLGRLRSERDGRG